MRIVDFVQKSLSGNYARCLLLVCLLCGLTSSFAHNKVVVIPMAGDDVQILEPSMPVTDINLSSDDYNLVFSDNPLLGAVAVIDKTTGLEWQRGSSGTTLNWASAWFYCRELVINLHSDWRLPTVLELQSIVDYAASDPAVESDAFPVTESVGYWSSETFAPNIDSAWLVNFNTGSLQTGNKSTMREVRCVR